MTWRRELVHTGRRSLILAGADALALLPEQAREALTRGARLFVITDGNVAAAWDDTVTSLLGATLRAGDTLVLPPGEATKSVANLQQCWDWLAQRGCRRSDVVVALGGGVVGDLAGLAAATYQRGVGLWQIPTTLLAQVDSSVGGKTAVNLQAGKNLVGAFYQPNLVMVDPTTLNTLPEEEYVSGLGEVVKYGLLDAALFDLLEQERMSLMRRDPPTLASVVQRCIDYKATVVEQDELDRGERAVLNLGHTLGHALEVTVGYGVLSHGRAVALGLLAALFVSERVLGLSADMRDRTRRLLQEVGLPVVLPLPPADAILAATAKDKKVTAKGIGFVGLRALGEPVWGLHVPADVLTAALEVIEA